MNAKFRNPVLTVSAITLRGTILVTAMKDLSNLIIALVLVIMIIEFISAFIYILNLFIDINECNISTHNCDPLADCENLNGSFTCVCRPGFTGSGIRSFCQGI